LNDARGRQNPRARGGKFGDRKVGASDARRGKLAARFFVLTCDEEEE
jgi:hypothetical protein